MAATGQRKFTDQVDVLRVLKNAKHLGWATVGLAAVSTVLAPNAIVVCGAMAACGYWTVTQAKRKTAVQAASLGKLGAKRTFIFKPDGSDLPMAPVTENTPRWEPSGICFEMVRDEEPIRSADGPVAKRAWYRYRVLAQHMASYQGQEAWLQQHHPERWALCRIWWLRGYIVPALARRWPSYRFSIKDPPPPGDTVVTEVGSGDIARTPATWTVQCRRHDETDSSLVEVAQEWIAEVVRDHHYHRFLAVRLALLPSLWTRRLDQRPSRRALGFLSSALMDLVKDVRPPPPKLPEPIRVTFAVVDQICVGRGVEWDLRHAKSLMEQMSFDRSTVSTDSPDDGDPRIFGVAADEASNVFFPEAWFSQHCLIAGTTGTGKTCGSEAIVTTAIRGGFAIVFVDPKGSRPALNRIYYEARKVGRGEQVHLFHFNEAKNPEIASYNPLYEYDDPSELASRIASVVARSSDPTWFYSALGTAKSVVTLAHYVLEYLRIVGSVQVPVHGGGSTTQLYPRYARVPPKICMALALKAEIPSLSPPDAERIINDALQHRRDLAWVPQNEAERILHRMFNDDSGAWFSPAVWSPSMRPVNTWGVGSPEVLVGHAIRVVYQHLWATYISEEHAEAKEIPGLMGRADTSGKKGQLAVGEPDEDDGRLPAGWGLPVERKRQIRRRMRVSTGELRDVNCWSLANTLGVKQPNETPAESILGRDPFSAHAKPKNERGSWKRMVSRFKGHPASDRNAHMAPDPEIVAFFNHFVSLDATMMARLQDVIKMFGEALETMWIKAVEDRREHQKHQLTLSTSLSKFEGERERIISNVDPDINLRQVVADKAIAIFYMNYMKDPEAVEGMARVIICDALGYLGGVSGNTAKGRFDWYLVCDECSVFLNQYIVPIVALGRSVGVRTALIMQNRVDLDVSMASHDRAAQTLGNLSIKFQLRTETQADAKAFSEKTGEVTVPVDTGLSRSFTPGYGKTGLQTIEAFSVNESRNVAMQKVPLVDPNALMKLPKGHYFASAFGRTWLLVQGLLPDAPDTNILEEYDILRYDPALGERRPPIVGNRLEDLHATNAALEMAMPRAQARPDSVPENEALPAIREGHGGVIVAGTDSKAGSVEKAAAMEGDRLRNRSPAVAGPSVPDATYDSKPSNQQSASGAGTNFVTPSADHQPERQGDDDLNFSA